MHTKIIGLIILGIILISIVYFFVGLMFERRKLNKKVREFAERADAKKKFNIGPTPVTNIMPIVGFTLYREVDGKILYTMAGTSEEVSELLAPELRKNKILRDMIKSAFVKANKTIK